eukprot:Nitzschia sp. Nitz4//scaffold9_size221794//50822//51706//NITZ4_001330-RA/size221794-processed-gene-0.314-mRNA-1//-1//CDS//3329560953//382//frame0
MMRLLISVALLLSSVDAATRVAVIELGKAGTVHRTTSSTEASAAGVKSFWSALHGLNSRKLQHAGMQVVPDLFRRPESGVVVGLSGVDLDTMPELSALLESGVGSMEVAGSQAASLQLPETQQVEPSTLTSAFKAQAAQAGLSGVHMEVTSEQASQVDQQVADLVRQAAEDAASQDRTVVLHLLVEEEEGSARRRLLSRRLQEDEEEDKDGEADADADADAQANYFYGYGYYNAYDEWVSPYKSMFQIQYFNVVLWTSLGLSALVFYTFYLFMFMPLMPDTLLFGESAKVVHAD